MKVHDKFEILWMDEGYGFDYRFGDFNILAHTRTPSSLAFLYKGKTWA